MPEKTACVRTAAQRAMILQMMRNDQVKKLLKKIVLESGGSTDMRELYNGVLRVYHRQYIPIALITARHTGRKPGNQYTGIVAWNPETRNLATLFPVRNMAHQLESKPPTFTAAEICAQQEYKNPVWKVALVGD